MSPIQPHLRPDDEDFMSDKKAAFLNKPTLLANSVLLLIALLLVVGLIWAYFGTVEQRTIGNGKVIPSTEDKVVQSLDGGIIDKILVHEGESVEPQQPLVKLDDVRYTSDFKNGYAKYLALSAETSRLFAETQDSDTIEFSKDVLKYPELVQRETKLFQARKQSLEQEIKNLTDSLALAKDEFKMYEQLVKKGVVTKLDYDRAKTNINDIQEKIYEKEDQFRENALTQLNQRKADLESVVEALIGLRDKMIRTTLRSPVKGIIKKIYITTVGGVINPGMDILEIVPISDTLLIEARIQPSDIAFIKIGQTATVKITAYDYSIYGSLIGKVEYISADAIEEPKTSPLEKTPTSYYLVRIRTDKSYLGTQKHPLPIMPGMTTIVNIVTGKKTVLDYLMKPLLKAKEEALRER